MLIIRRSNYINTASGIVSSVSDPSGVQVDKFLLNLHIGRSLTECTIPDAVLIQFGLLMMSSVARNIERIIIINVFYIT